MYSIAQTFELKPGCFDEYRKAHDDLWPEVARAMQENRVEMVIYRWRDRLFLYATAPSRRHLEKSYEGEAAHRWAAYMATLLKTDEQGKSLVEVLEPVFRFGAPKPAHEN